MILFQMKHGSCLPSKAHSAREPPALFQWGAEGHDRPTADRAAFAAGRGHRGHHDGQLRKRGNGLRCVAGHGDLHYIHLFILLLGK